MQKILQSMFGKMEAQDTLTVHLSILQNVDAMNHEYNICFCLCIDIIFWGNQSTAFSTLQIS